MSPRPIVRRRVGPALRFVPPRWAAEDASDPFGAALELHEDRQTLGIAALGALLLYGGAVLFTIQAHVAPVIAAPQRVELPVVQALRTPPPPPPAAPASNKEEAPVQPRRARRVAPPPPAEASQVVTRASSEPVDLSSFSIATGHAAAFAGGYTSGNGTSHSAVVAPNAGRAAAPPSRAGPSLARSAQPARRDWSCAWPDDAQQSDLRDTRVTVKVAVSADGDASEAQVQGGALAGFAEAARRCALAEQYRPALDASGRRIAGETPLLSVHFVR